MTPKDTPHTATQGAKSAAMEALHGLHNCLRNSADDSAQASLGDMHLKRGVKAVKTLFTRVEELEAALAQRQPAPADPYREELLHTAICQAVSIMNTSVELAQIENGRKVRTILGQALVDYADAVMNEPTTEDEQQHMRKLHRSRP